MEAERVDLDHVLVADRRERAGLALEAGAASRLCAAHEGSIILSATGRPSHVSRAQVDDAHPAAPQLGLDPVAAVHDQHLLARGLLGLGEHADVIERHRRVPAHGAFGSSGGPAQAPLHGPCEPPDRRTIRTVASLDEDGGSGVPS